MNSIFINHYFPISSFTNFQTAIHEQNGNEILTDIEEFDGSLGEMYLLDELRFGAEGEMLIDSDFGRQKDIEVLVERGYTNNLRAAYQ